MMWRRRRRRGWHRRRRGSYRAQRHLSPSPLTGLAVGQRAEVVAITSTRPSRLTHLSMFGLVPGSQIRLQQRRPAFVVQIGETEVTLDADVARDIIVRVA